MDLRIISTKTLLAMKFLILLLTAAAFNATAKGHAQKITLNLSNAPLQQAFTEINKQTGYNFIYTTEQLAATHPVSLKVKDENLQKVLQLCFDDQPLTFTIEDHYIIIKEKIPSTTPSLLDIKGKVTGENGEPLVGATVTVKGTPRAVATDEKGEFILTGLNPADILTISNVGYQTREIPLNGKTFVEVQLLISVNSLDETVMIAYGKTTKRLNTGSVSKVTAEEISRQPVSNPLAALEGRVPGLIVTQSSGVPGSSFKIELRGRTSLDASVVKNDPLFIIDGVPFAQGNDPINQIRSAGNNPRQSSDGGLSPFELINPSDIESIEVLKDADATAIYGSRGANGVILITTKKGKSGPTKITADVYSGISKVTRTVSMMNTQQYIAMRKEALANDGIIPTSSNAPDLMIWDTTRYTDFKKMFIGGTAHNANFQTTVSGGNNSIQFMIGAGYHRETTVYPGNFCDNRGSFHLSLSHLSPSKKFNISLQVLYASGKNNLLSTDLTTYINLPPNLPPLYDSSGKLNWSQGGVSFVNPLAELLRVYTAKSENLSANLQLSYKIFSSLRIKTDFGYSSFHTNEVGLHPLASIDPRSSSLAFSDFANSEARSWIIEPQLEYTSVIRKNKFSFLLGTTWQSQDNNSTYIDAENYTSDLLLSSLAAAPLVYGSNNSTLYRYNAIFSRATLNIKNKYLLNFSARRDASSRFGPGHQFGNFGAAGLAWIFSNEKWIQKKLHFLSFGKWRMSYGITGNDQVGDYRFLDSWQNAALTYQGVSGLQPSRLFNPDYSWEVNRKWETALDIGIFKDKVLFSAAYFINRSGNRLINYTLPAQTGFTSVLENWKAIIQNNGLELSLTMDNISINKIKWTSAAVIAFPKNKLVSFPNLSVSSYKTTYVEGYSLSAIYAIRFLGVDPATGIYRFQDIDSNNTFNSNDYKILGRTDPIYDGSWNNSFNYKNWQLDFFIQFRKQTGLSYLFTQSNEIPGYWLNNEPVYDLNPWRKPGDQAMIQRYTATAGSAAYKAATSTLQASNALFTDASFIRFKTLSCSYHFPKRWIEKTGFQNCKLYLQAQNLFTITGYKGADPENQNLYILPPLRTITFGIQLSL